MLATLSQKIATFAATHLSTAYPNWKRILMGRLPVNQAAIIASVLTTGLVVGVQEFWGLQAMELLALDQMVRLQTQFRIDPRLLVVEITEDDLATQEEWPISDATLAEAIGILQQYNPSVVGLDLYRNLPHPPGVEALQAEFQASNLVVITKLPDGEEAGVPAPPGVPEARIGFNDFVLDPDGVIRRNFLYAYLDQEQQFYSFALRLALTYFQAQGYDIEVTPRYLRIEDALLQPLRPSDGGYQSINAVGLQILIDYRWRDVAERVSLSQVLNREIRSQQVEDRIVLIGSTGHSILQDNFLTPHSAAETGNPHWPGVLIHAQLTHQILSTVLDRQPLIWFWPQWGEVLWLWVWALVGGHWSGESNLPCVWGALRSWRGWL
jgi:CHASE2 domain-containing sensor protein